MHSGKMRTRAPDGVHVHFGRGSRANAVYTTTSNLNNIPTLELHIPNVRMSTADG